MQSAQVRTPPFSSPNRPSWETLVALGVTGTWVRRSRKTLVALEVTELTVKAGAPVFTIGKAAMWHRKTGAWCPRSMSKYLAKGLRLNPRFPAFLVDGALTVRCRVGRKQMPVTVIMKPASIRLPETKESATELTMVPLPDFATLEPRRDQRRTAFTARNRKANTMRAKRTTIRRLPTAQRPHLRRR